MEIKCIQNYINMCDKINNIIFDGVKLYGKRKI
nr:MAG TPA: hypothetical protein [Caudoviricetes sp.]